MPCALGLGFREESWDFVAWGIAACYRVLFLSNFKTTI